MFKVGGKVRCIKKGLWKNENEENVDTHFFNDPTYGQILTVEEIIDDEQGEAYLGFSGINDAVYLSIHFIPLEETGDIFIESILEEIYLSNA